MQQLSRKKAQKLPVLPADDLRAPIGASKASIALRFLRLFVAKDSFHFPMKKTLKLLIVAGARPNFMKVAPLIRSIRAWPADASPALEYRRSSRVCEMSRKRLPSSGATKRARPTRNRARR
jgi:hypothetical protein